MRTIFQPENANFSQKAHLAARIQIYPSIFKTTLQNLEFEDTILNTSERNTILDGEMGIDRIVNVAVKNLHAPLVFTIQERFRRPEYAHYKDLTITEWNGASGLPSELYKINAGLFLYGYFNEFQNTFIDAIAINTTDLLIAICRNEISYTKRRNKKQQDFVAFTFSGLENAGVVKYHLEKTRRKLA